MKLVTITKEQFYEMFSSDRYKWIGNKSPDLDWWEPHINFVWDKEEEKTVGFRRTSSWNPDVEYAYFRKRTEKEEEEYQEYLKNLEVRQKEFKEKREKSDSKRISIQPLDPELMIPYEPTEGGIDKLVRQIKKLWFDK